MKTSKALHIKIQVITIILSREHEATKDSTNAWHCLANTSQMVFTMVTAGNSW